MTIWLDANLDPALAAWLGSRFGVVAKHLTEMALENATDQELFAAAKRFDGIVIASKDSDFVDLVTLYGPPPQVLWLTCGNLPTLALQVLLSAKLPEAIRLLRAGEPWVEVG